MARSSLVDIQSDLQDDTGGVLWSFVQGEQVEFLVTFNFLTNAGMGYTYEAVIMEAANLLGDITVPTAVRTNGVNSTLVVRVPTERGAWSGTEEYSREDVVVYNLITYKSKSGVNRVSSTPPSSDPAFWEEYEPNKVYIQFPATVTFAQTVSAVATIGTPGKFTAAGHPFKEGNPVVFGGTPPAEITAGTTYFVVLSGLTSSDFRVATTPTGAPIAFSDVGSNVTATLPAWAVQPTIIAPVYGFFELRVTEPNGNIYPRTWKPMRGLVQYLYSPTQVVPG